MSDSRDTASSIQSAPALDKRTDVVIAEFNALRAEMVARITIQATLIGTGITGIGVVVGFAIGQTGNRSLLVLVPLISALVLFLYANQSYRIIVLGDYIRRCQLKYLRDIFGSSLPSWEYEIKHDTSRTTKLVKASLDAALDVMLIAASVGSLVYADGVALWVRYIAGFLLLLTSAIRLWVGFRRRPISQQEEAELRALGE